MTLNLDRSAWRKVKFGDVVRNVNDNVKDPASVGIKRALGLEHLGPGELRIQRWSDVSPESTFTRRVSPGQTLFGKRRAYQRKTAYAEFDAVCSGDILVFESADTTRLLPELLPFIAMTDSFYAMALETSAGSLSPRTRWSDIAKYEFDLPPLGEQRRIADMLWCAERHATELEAAIAAVNHCLDAFVDGVIWAGAGQFVRVADLSAGGELTDGDWVESKDMSPDGTVRLLQLADIGRGAFLDKSDRWITEEKSAALGVNRLSAGDVLISRMAEPIGRSCVVPDLGGEAITAVDVAILRPLPGLRPSWLLAVLNSSSWTAAVERHARGTTRTRVSRRDLQEVQVPDPHGPSVPEQDAAIRSFSAAESALRSELDLLRGAKASILAEFVGTP